MASINPSSTATQLATAYTASAQSVITSQTKTAQTKSTALTTLQSALSTFNSALSGLSTGQTMTAYSASFSASGFATATATPTAQAGSNSLFVEQVASAHQVAFTNLPAVPVAMGGPLVVHLANGSAFTVNLQASDANSDGTISQTEIARAINMASGNNGLVAASTVTVGTQTQLVLSAGSTGAGSQITLDTTGLPASSLQTALNTPTQLVAAQDAIVWLGAQGTGIKLQQASNTVTAINGVSMTLTQAMPAGAAPMTMTLASDTSKIAANVRSFVDAYNALGTALKGLTANGSSTTTRAAFASDSGVLALRSSLSSALRQTYGGVTLASLGISADRSGTLSLDQTKLTNTLAANPAALTQAFGSTTFGSASGALGGFQSIVKSWTDSTSGMIKQRQNSLQSEQKALTDRQTRLDNQYNSSYNRYLTQFTQLQNLQSSMSNTSGILTNLG